MSESIRPEPIPGLDVVVCRGCCCGTFDKHPDADHEAQLAALREAAESADGRFLVANCLNSCDYSNVVVVRTRRTPDRKPQAVWLGGMLDTADTARLCDWIANDGPRDPVGPVQALPADLDARRIPSPQDAKQALAELVATNRSAPALPSR